MKKTCLKVMKYVHPDKNKDKEAKIQYLAREI